MCIRDRDTWLFNGTIRENIRYGRPDASDDEVEAAARAARCDHFIHTLAGGYDFMINEEGTNLSQGQRQLVTIARAILADRPALILDEATSNVDTRTEMCIRDRVYFGRFYLGKRRRMPGGSCAARDPKACLLYTSRCV